MDSDGNLEIPGSDLDKPGTYVYTLNYTDMDGGQHTRTATVTVGAQQDSDGDGVTDNLDQCPATPAGADVDADGCVTSGQGSGDAYLTASPMLVDPGHSSTLKWNAPDATTATASAEYVDPDGNRTSLDNSPFSGTVDPSGKLKIPGSDQDKPGTYIYTLTYKDSNGDTHTQTAVVKVGADDIDGDGVPNDDDLCPNTPAGEQVDANGCSDSQLQDDDSDGVPNGQDQCPNTPSNLAGQVDSTGCADPDGDGVPAQDDKCPDTDAGASVDADGCSDKQNAEKYCSNPDNLFYIVSVDPANDSKDALRDQQIVVTFSQKPDENSLEAAISSDQIGLKKADDGAAVPVSLDSVDGNKAIFVADDPLEPSTQYVFYIKGDGSNIGPQAAKCAASGLTPKYMTVVQTNADGSAKLDNDGNPTADQGNTEDDTTFSTIAANQLAVESTNPQDGKTAGTDATPSVTFNKPIQDNGNLCTSPDGALTLEQIDDQGNATPVAGSCAVSNNGKTVTFTPDQKLDGDAHYRFTAHANKIQPQDSGVDPLQQDTVVEFDATGVLDTSNCVAPAANDKLCLLGKDGKGGLVDKLLADDGGPLSPLASNIGGKEELASDLRTLLANDDGSLGSLVTGLVQDGHLQDGLQQLLLDPDNGLQTILPDLLTGDENGNGGLQGLLGTDGGAASLLQALLVDGNDLDDCKSSVGTVCLMGEDGTTGVLDLLVSDKGYLGDQGLPEDTLYNALETTLQNNDGSLQDVVTSLVQDGNLQDGLTELLVGNDNSEGLAGVLQDTGSQLPDALSNVLGGLLGGLGGGGLLGG